MMNNTEREISINHALESMDVPDCELGIDNGLDGLDAVVFIRFSFRNEIMKK
jgi:hypothetical protein